MSMSSMSSPWFLWLCYLMRCKKTFLMGPSLRTLRWEITLDYPGGPKQLHESLQAEKKVRAVPRGGSDPSSLVVKGERKGHESRKRGQPQEVGMALSWQPSRRMGACILQPRGAEFCNIFKWRTGERPPQFQVLETQTVKQMYGAFSPLSGGANLLRHQQGNLIKPYFFPQKIKPKIISQKATLLHCW